jgi:hypothetical protein
MQLQRRSEIRIPIPGGALVCVYRLRADIKVFLCETLVADASSRGIGIFTDVPLQSDTTVHLESRYGAYKALVKNCVTAREGFRSGLLFIAE